MEVGKFYVTKTGEAFRVISGNINTTEASAFESDFVMAGPTQNIAGLMESAGMKEIDEMEYKLRVVAMRMFQDCKNEDDYPYKDSYLGEYEDMKKMMTPEAIEGFFSAGGGYRDYANEELED